ncbi:MAG: UDP-glucose 4-epimerase GalE [Arthrobacter sp.]|jgi:UDP-glucose 4-epimerase|nr:UDP-glucose 4-epimerase GalE [Arthrobacter sp.]
MRVLTTGGAGYIGSHTVLALVEAGHEPVILDNFANSSPEAVRRVSELAGREIELIEADLLDAPAVDRIVADGNFDAVIHFAGLKAVGESAAQPLRYYRSNILSTLNLLDAMQKHGVRNVVFSSSATVYGEAGTVQYTEELPLNAMNPYGRTKMHIEQILDDLAASEPGWHIGKLRYFNPVGAHPSGRIGEDPRGIPNNLMPFVSQVAVGRREHLNVFGDDYPTPDGTGVRDYIHVVDLAGGHVAALEALGDVRGSRAWNLGSGQGSSVLEVVRAFERAAGRPIPYVVAPRRDGDLPEFFADPTLARLELHWKTERGLDDMARDAWNWQSKNPFGYGTGEEDPEA